MTDPAPASEPCDRPDPLAGKVALVTGAARRVGRQIALTLADAGMDVAITYRTSGREASAVTDEITRRGRRALAVEVDLAEPRAADLVHEAVTARFDRLDALVNNASTFDPLALGQMTAEAFDRQMAVNARGPLMLIHRFADRLGAAYDPADPQSPGRIVNFIDIHVLGQPLAGYVAYNASKAALYEITKTLSLELAPRVTVNAVAPGVVAWAEAYSEQDKRQYMARVPLDRPGTPVDAAEAVRYLVGAGSYCTGQVIKLDGGRLLT